MDFVHSLSGMVEAEITSGDIPAMLAAISREGIRMESVSDVQDLKVRICVCRSDYRKLTRICDRRGDSLFIVQRHGLYWKWKAFVKRPVLWAGIMLLLLWIVFVPTRVFFFRVEGNERIPEKRILEAAEQCGMAVGASRREVRSERMKNALLQELPELQWAGINTYGCVGVISVRERSITTEKQTAGMMGNIVALRDGIVSSCTATRGTLLCHTGQAVMQGQVLISGYTDCGLLIQATGAEGEVYGTTNRKIIAVMPETYAVKQFSGAEKQQYSLLIGKKRIKLWKDSGISDSSCGRIYEENYITLPGGFQLPFGLATDTWILASVAGRQAADFDAETYLRDFARNYICQQMIAGNVETEEIDIVTDNDIYRLAGEYVCTEMIGKWQAEQIGETNG